jgi:DNA-binding response OmpR family regulator
MSNLTLLYAEDDALVRDTFAYLLNDLFAKVYLAENGKEAYEMYRHKKPDIILLDNFMPAINGLDVARLIRKEDENVPIIILTAHSEREQLLKAVDLKLETYLVKPVTPETLIAALQKVIQKLENTNIYKLSHSLVWDNNTKILRHGDKIIKLTKKEKLAVEVLINNINTYVRNETLIYHIWDDEIPDESHDNKLIQLIYRINKKISSETGSKEKFIENSYTLGYRILSAVDTQ